MALRKNSKIRTSPHERGDATSWQAKNTIVSGMAGRYATALFDLAREAMRSTRSRPTSNASTRSSPKAPISIAWCAARYFPPRSSCRRSPRCSTAAGIGGLAAKFLKLVTVEPPPVRGARHDQGLSRAGRRITKARRPPRLPSPKSSRTNISRRCAPRSKRSAARTSTSISRSIPPLSAGSWSSSAAAWSIPRCAPSSTQSSTR